VILPTKTIAPSRCLLGVGANVLRLLDEPKPISRLWPELKVTYERLPDAPAVPFAWFVLSLDLLFAFGAIRLDHGRIMTAAHDSQDL
jgi:hypothetical protein